MNKPKFYFKRTWGREWEAVPLATKWDKSNGSLLFQVEIPSKTPTSNPFISPAHSGTVAMLAPGAWVAVITAEMYEALQANEDDMPTRPVVNGVSQVARGGNVQQVISVGSNKKWE